MFHGHSGAVEASEWDRGKINEVERELPQAPKDLVMVEPCREGAGRGERAIFWQGKRSALACCERVRLI